MGPKTAVQPKGNTEICTFWIGEALCGVDILDVQEVNRHVEVTPVPQAAEYIAGVINLRGRVVTIIDLGMKLGLSPARLSSESQNLIVRSEGELIGLLVDRIADVVTAESATIDPPPPNLTGPQSTYFQGVVMTDGCLISLLNVEAVLAEE